MVRNFLEFVEEKKQDDKKPVGVASKTSLGDGNDFKPFTVSDDPNSEHYGANSSLAPVVRAFKKGANWGWSKDDKTGEDKAVKISGRKLFLSGGAVRDHLAGKKPRNIELTTNASPDEIYHILKQNEFQFEGDSDGDSGKQSFWVMEKDVNGRPCKFGIRVKNDEFELSVFSANAKGVPGEFKPGTQEEDAASRDFTMNALSLALTNDNGPNKDVQDFFGGMHHLKGGQVVPIGDFSQKLSEDPMRALRYARMQTRYGKPDSIQPKDKEALMAIIPKLASCDRGKVCDEFSKIFNYEDTDARDAMQTYGDLGVLDGIFPGMQLDKKLPKELKEIGDKHMPLAYMMRQNPPEEIEFNMTGFQPEILKKIMFLINSLGISENVDPTTLSQLRNDYFGSGITSRGLKSWTTKIAHKDERLIDAFIEHVRSPRVMIYKSDTSNDIHEDFKDFVNPFTGKLNPENVEDHRKQLEHRNFLAILKKHMPKV